MLEELKGKLVLVVYTEDGETRTTKGRLTSFDEEFVKIETLVNTFLISRATIQKIKLPEGLNGRS